MRRSDGVATQAVKEYHKKYVNTLIGVEPALSAPQAQQVPQQVPQQMSQMPQQMPQQAQQAQQAQQGVSTGGCGCGGGT